MNRAATHDSRRRVRPPGTRRRDRGAATAVLVIMTAAILMALGLVSDGAEKIRVGRLATTTAQEAARAAGQHLTTRAIVGQVAGVDVARGAAAARAYLAAAGVNGTVTVSTDTVNVTTTVQWQPRFLAGLTEADTMTGTATARAARP